MKFIRNYVYRAMPLARRRNVRRRPLRRKRALIKRRKALGRRMNAMRDRATVVEVMQDQVMLANTGNTISHHLGQFARATAVSKNFRFYRCKKVEVEFIPYANVFPSGQCYPQLYYQVDRTQGTNGIPGPAPTEASMMSRGVLPIKFTSPVKRWYSPSVLRNENFIQNVLGSDVQSVAAVTSTPVLYKWYATQQYFNPPPGNAASQIQPTWGPLNLEYYGAAYYVDLDIPPATPGVGVIKMKVHWEFKEPLVVPGSS